MCSFLFMCIILLKEVKAMEIVKYVLLGVNVLSLVVTIIAFLAKNKGVKSSKLVSKLLALIPALVSKAEAMFGRGNGEAKLNYVVQALEMQALKEGYSVNEETLVKAVNNVVETTKNVNVVRVEEVSSK